MRTSDAEQRLFDRKVLETVTLLEAAHRDNLAQGPQAEWFNLYAYLLYHVPHQKMAPYAVGDTLGYALDHPCNCGNLNFGWVQFKDGVVISGLTVFWEQPQPELMVPFCIDVNGPTAPNQSGRDVFLGRLYNRQPNTKAVFDWKSTHFGCEGKQYVPVEVALQRLAPPTKRKR